MTSTRITTIAGCVFAASSAAQAVPGIDTIPYARVILGIITAASGAITAYFMKGRSDTGAV